jgi:hypothetical protein
MHRAKVIAFRSDQTATWQELLEEFLTFKRAQGRSPRTLQDYDDTMNLFFKRYPLSWNGETPLTSLT